MKFIVYRTSAGGPCPLDETPYPPPCEGTTVLEVRHRMYPYGRPLFVNVIKFDTLTQFVLWAQEMKCPVVLDMSEPFFKPPNGVLINVLEIKDQRE